MTRYTVAAGLAGVVALGAVYAGVVPATQPAAPAGGPAWEYKVVRGGQLSRTAPTPEALSEAMTRLGADGWELVGAMPSPAGGPVGASVPKADQSSVDRSWSQLAQGADRINLNDPGQAPAKQQLELQRVKLPPDGVLTKEHYQAEMNRLREASFASTEPTYYFKRPKR